MSKSAAFRPTFASHVTFVDSFRADAGNTEAQFDSRACAVFTAYFNAYKHGQMTQFDQLAAAVAMYTSAKACNELVGRPADATPNAAAKRAFIVAQAYRAALDACGRPALMKKATNEECDALACEKAGEFAGIVTVAVTPEERPVLSAEEKAKAKAEKEAAKAETEAKAEADKQAAIQAEATRIAGASVVTLADMVRIVANAARTGMLDTEALATLDSALDSIAVVEVVERVIDVAESAHA